MSDYIIGRKPVMEYLKTGQGVEKLYLQRGEKHGSIQKILGMARDRDVVIVELDREKLDQMVGGANHQGVVLLSEQYHYASLEDILKATEAGGRAPFILLLDEITDPHNLGAIIRTAECCGVDGILIPKRRSALVTSTVYKTSAGAVSHVRLAKINNVNQTMELLKKHNIWVYGLAAEARQSLWETDFSGGVCLVVGNEGQGLSKTNKEHCDLLLSIPMVGKLNSLNASVSAGIAMYEVLRGRIRGKR